MTAAEKNQLYSNLRTISAWAQGYPSASFNGEIPAFTDDQELVLHQESVQEVSFQDTTDVSAPQIQGRQFQEASLEEISHRQEAIAQLEAQIKQCHRC